MIRTSSRAGWIALGLVGATASGVGLYLALRQDEDKASLPASKSPTALPRGSDASADVDRVVLAVVDDIVPGTRAAIEQLRAALLANPAAVKAVLARYATTSAAFAQQLAEQKAIAAQRLVEARGILSQLQQADQAMDVIGNIPVIGAIIKGVYQVARQFGEAYAAERAAGRDFISNGATTGVPNFFGWLADPNQPGQGDYWALNLPVLSLTAPVQLGQYLAAVGEVYGLQLRLLAALCSARPFGLQDIPWLTITPSGQYSYKFNLQAPGDISQAASDARQVYWVDVWDVADISAQGPRDFDPANPKAWYLRAKTEAHPIPVPPGPSGSYS